MKYQINKAVVIGSGTMGAAIAAHLDQKEEALRLLRQALQEGRPVAFLHADPWVMPLWGYEPFEQVVGPKG